MQNPTTSGSSLDNEELFRLALLDMKESRHEDAIGRLKRLVLQDPGNAGAYCLLGAEHAELGMLDRAVTEFERAITLNPVLAVAHFQLGLIHYVRNDVTLAERHWERLPGLPESAALAAFSAALLLAARGRLQEALGAVDRGLASNPSEALARDMQRVRANLEAQIQSGVAPKTTAAPKTAGENRHALLNNYAAEPGTPEDPKKSH